MLTGMRPWQNAPTKIAIIMSVYQLGKRLPIPEPPRCPPALASLISACWAQSPLDRPGAAQVLRQLKGILWDELASDITGPVVQSERQRASEGSPREE